MAIGGTRQKLSMIAGITNQGKARWMIIDGAFNHEKLIEFFASLIKDAGARYLTHSIVDRRPVPIAPRAPRRRRLEAQPGVVSTGNMLPSIEQLDRPRIKSHNHSPWYSFSSLPLEAV